MPRRYWVIAPYSSQDAARFDAVWRFDLENGSISIGWNQLGDVSNLDRDALASAVAREYPERPPATRSLFTNMVWNFYHEITPDDVVLARRGQRILTAIGTVTRAAHYEPGRNPHLVGFPHIHSNFIDVIWRGDLRDKAFGANVFPRHTLTEFTEVQYQNIVGDERPAPHLGAQPVFEPVDAIADQNSFVLEKYLEDFIVSNFAQIFKNELTLSQNDDDTTGQQYPTDIGPIEILAFERATNSFVVIELKKGRPSDQVVGQVLRYMGWVKANLCGDAQSVKGLVICRDQDQRLTYALSMTDNVRIKYYGVSFKLNDNPV